MSAPVTAIRPIGTGVNLICTVELSPFADVPVTVTTEWTGPDEFSETTSDTAQPVMGSNTIYTSTAMISSFGRGKSGSYKCIVNVSSVSPFITGSDSKSRAANVSVGKADIVDQYSHYMTDADVNIIFRYTGVYLSLMEIVYPNNSIILIIDIKEADDTASTPHEGLQCITDRILCCRKSRTGQWYFPDSYMDSRLVPIKGINLSYYRNRGDDGSVNLNRKPNITSPTGLFCCKVLDAQEITQTLHANIGIHVLIGL